MLQQQPEDMATKLRDTSASILIANGFQLVTHDKRLFPNFAPDLAALKGGQLLVFAVKAFPTMGQFLRPEELNDIRQELEAVIEKNNPTSDPRVNRVQPVALIMTPEEVTVASEAGDIQWLTVSDFDELPEEMDKLLM